MHKNIDADTINFYRIAIPMLHSDFENSVFNGVRNDSVSDTTLS